MPERGATLVEVLVAVAVLALGLAGATRLLGASLAGEAQAALQEQASQRLADALELAQAWPTGPPAAPVATWQADAAATRGGEARIEAAAHDGARHVFQASVRWSTAARPGTLAITTFEAAPTP